MRLSVLSSGSKGNTTYIETEKTKILIDAGNTNRYVINKLKELNVDLEDIDAILITHTHSDHIKGLPLMSKKIRGIVYITKLMYPQLDYLTNYKTQINWGLGYIKSRYGSPEKAWNFFQQKGWY